jgi:hypothetical protein
MKPLGMLSLRALYLAGLAYWPSQRSATGSARSSGSMLSGSAGIGTAGGAVGLCLAQRHQMTLRIFSERSC